MTGAPAATPTMSAICWRHRRGADQLAGLQVLQVVVRDRRAGEDDRRDEEREGDQRRPRLGRRRQRERRAPTRTGRSTGCRRPRSGCSRRRSGRPCSRRSPAIRKPPTSTNGTAISVERDGAAARAACRATNVARRATPVSARQATVSADDPAGDRSRSRSSPGRRRARGARACSPARRPPGLARVASVQIAATPMVPAPMKRTCVPPDVHRVGGQRDAGRRPAADA